MKQGLKLWHVRRGIAMGAVLCMAGLVAQNAGDVQIERLNPNGLPKLDYLTQVVRVKNGKTFLYIAGQTAINAKVEIVGQTVEAQADTALKNLDYALQAG